MSDQPKATEAIPDIKGTVDYILDQIEREREREIISRRFGLNDRKETLEQIGELLGITRERVRQLEKAILIRLKMSAESGVSEIDKVEKFLIRNLHELGRAAKLQDLADRLDQTDNKHVRSHVAFISELAPNLTVLSENENYQHGVAIREYYPDEKKLKTAVDEIVKAVKENGEAIDIEALHERIGKYEHPDHTRALATLSKNLANLRDSWGLTKWPTVNPKNIRDKIYVILQENGKPMHFSEISDAIKDSDFKRKDVTTQAIHNELIKDKRFVLIGRGIYALSEWGYSKGTVSDIIMDILQKEAAPLHRDEIVRRVLKHRHVKETTILLNLQSKPQFKRVAKATYVLADKPA